MQALNYKINELNMDEEKLLRHAVTKKCESILKLLLSGSLTNKEIASRLNTPANSISNAILRIKNAPIPLLTIEQEGRNTFYSLTSAGKEYIQNRINEEKRVEPNKKIIDLENEQFSIDVQDTIEKLNSLKRTIGDGWRNNFQLFLEDYGHERVQTHRREDIEFQYIMQKIEFLIKNDCRDELNEIYEFIDDDKIQEKIESCLEQLIATRLLCILDQRDWYTAYMLIEDYFEHMGDSVKMEALEKLQPLHIEIRDLVHIFHRLKTMSDEAEKECFTKKEFYDKWRADFHLHEKMLYHIAEQYAIRQENK